MAAHQKEKMNGMYGFETPFELASIFGGFFIIYKKSVIPNSIREPGCITHTPWNDLTPRLEYIQLIGTLSDSNVSFFSFSYSKNQLFKSRQNHS